MAFLSHSARIEIRRAAAGIGKWPRDRASGATKGHAGLDAECKATVGGQRGHACCLWRAQPGQWPCSADHRGNPYLLIENPKLAEELARADQERFPDGPDADERDALLVSAIYNQHEPLRARREARNYLRRHPQGRYAEQLMRVTGAHMPVATTSPSSP